MNRRSFLHLFGLSAAMFGAKAQAEEKAKGAYEGKVILITGATSGIGEHTAYAFAKAGAKVAFCGRRVGLGEKVEAAIRKLGHEAMYVPADVRKEDLVNAFVDKTLEKFGRIDICFLNAGESAPPGFIHDLPTERVLFSLETNFMGSFYTARRALRQMMVQKSGLIVANTTFGLRRAIPGEFAYAASKMAIRSLIEHIACDYIDYDIRAFSIEPLSVLTPRIEARAKFLKVPLERLVNRHSRRFIQPAEVGDLLVALCQQPRVLLNGQHLDISEGAALPFLYGKRAFNNSGFEK